MYYLLLLLMAGMSSLYASQDAICLSDGGESPLCASRTSSDEVVSNSLVLKRKRTEDKEREVANRMSRLDMSLPEEIFRQQALKRFFPLQQPMSAPILLRAAQEQGEALVPVTNATSLPVRPRVRINFAQLQGLTLDRIAPCLSTISLHKDITELHLAHLNLDIIPGHIYTLAELAVLNLSGNALSVVQDFSGLKKLRELNLAYNQISALPKKAFATDDLKVLFLEGNLLEEVDARFLPAAIQVLVLRNNQLKCLPRLTDKSQLKALDVSCNNIQSFDSQMLPQEMQSIDATQNRINAIKMMHNWAMDADGQILLGSNSLDQFPIQLCEVAGLRYLDLSCNAIVDMPAALAHSCFPNGGAIDLRANYAIKSDECLIVGRVREMQKNTNASRSRESRMSVLTASTMETRQANDLRKKWPNPKITYQVTGSEGDTLS